MNRFNGRKVLLTGAASGIGRATAIRLADEGASVFAVDLSEDGLAETDKAVAAATEGRPAQGGGIVTHTADVSDEQAVVATVRRAVGEMGGIDVLINVAGIHKTTPMATLQVADLRRLFDVNFVGTALFCREAIPHLPDGSGVIVNVASLAATQGTPYMAAYSASKGAVLSFSYCLAAELSGRRIRVVPISPGTTATPLLSADMFPADVDLSYFEHVRAPFGAADPAQIAATIAYAASPDASFLTGAELRVDGGAAI